MGYKLLGLVVWKGGRLFLRHRYGHLVPSRKVALAGLLGLLVAGVAVSAARDSGAS
jgi:hypothetical protein